MRSKLLADRKQDNFFTRPEWTGGNLFSGLTYSAFYFQQFWFFFLLFLFTDSNCLPGSSSWFCLVMSHSSRCQEAFQWACLKAQVSHVSGQHKGSLWCFGHALLPCVHLGKPLAVPCLPVLLWVSCSCFLFQRLCPMNKGSESYLLSTSHVDFSGLFLFCFEYEWKVLGHLMWLRLSFFVWWSPLENHLHLMALHALMSMKNWWSRPPSVLPCERGVVSACYLSETSFIYIVWGLLDFFPDRFRGKASSSSSWFPWV